MFCSHDDDDTAAVVARNVKPIVETRLFLVKENRNLEV